MAEISADRVMLFRYPKELRSEVWTADSSSAQVIYKGAPVILDANVDTVNVVTYDSVTPATGDIFVGFAAHGLSVALSAVEADQEVQVYTRGEIGFKDATFTDADVGKAIYMSDTGTFTVTGTGSILVGTLRRVTGGYAYIEVAAPAVLTIA